MTGDAIDPSSQSAVVAKPLWFVLLLGLQIACGETRPDDQRQQLRAHDLDACAVPADALLDLEALGDFGASL